MLIAIIVIVGLSVLILGHEAGHFLSAKLFGLKVKEFGFGFPPKAKSIRKGETEYSFNWLPFGGFVKIAGEEEQITEPEKLEALPAEEKKRYFLFQPAWKRSVVIGSGVFVNFLIGWALVSLVFMIGTPTLLVVSGVESGSPADKAGITSGDIIKNYSNSQDFIGFINGHRGQSVELNIVRGGSSVKISAVPRISTGPDEGALGVSFSESGIHSENFFAAVSDGFSESAYITGATIYGFYDMAKNIVSRGSIAAGVVGPVGIFSVAEKTGQAGLVYLIQLIGMISLNLAVVNLIPFPALDGGRLFLIAIEKIKGSPVSVKIQSYINGAGLVFLLLLMAVITVRDVANLF